MLNKTIPEGLTMHSLLASEQKKAAQLVRDRLRRWVTPLTMGTFLLSAVTGILLFFKIHLGLIKPVHEWLSWLLVIAAILHLYINWGPGARSVSSRGGRAIFLAFVVLLGLSFLPLAGQRHHQRPDALVRALAGASLESVAQLAHHHPEELLVMLRGQGLAIESESQTLEQIAARNNRQAGDLLGLIFY